MKYATTCALLLNTLAGLPFGSCKVDTRQDASKRRQHLEDVRSDLLEVIGTVRDEVQNIDCSRDSSTRAIIETYLGCTESEQKFDEGSKSFVEKLDKFETMFSQPWQHDYEIYSGSGPAVCMPRKYGMKDGIRSVEARFFDSGRRTTLGRAEPNSQVMALDMALMDDNSHLRHPVKESVSNLHAGLSLDSMFDGSLPATVLHVAAHLIDENIVDSKLYLAKLPASVKWKGRAGLIDHKLGMMKTYEDYPIRLMGQLPDLQAHGIDSPQENAESLTRAALSIYASKLRRNSLNFVPDQDLAKRGVISQGPYVPDQDQEKPDGTSHGRHAPESRRNIPNSRRRVSKSRRRASKPRRRTSEPSRQVSEPH